MLEDGSGPYYATRYNTFNHIPVYSAYTVNPQQAVKLGTVTLKRPKFFETPGLCSKFKLILCITYRLKLICIIFVEQYNAQNTVPLVYLEMAIVKVIITIPHQSINQSINQSIINQFIHPSTYLYGPLTACKHTFQFAFSKKAECVAGQSERLQQDTSIDS